MLELADRLLPALEAGERLVVATAIEVDGSAPRTLGTSMAWDGRAAIGSLAGGCVEGAVVEVAERVLDDGRTRLVEFGIPDSGPAADLALGVGLSCGGRIRIHLAAVETGTPGGDAVVAALRDAASGGPAAIGLTPDGFASAGSSWAGLPASAPAPECAPERLFVDVRTPPARMIIVGAMEFSSALASAAAPLGYAVTVCDPRELFLTAARFPGSRLALDWPPDYVRTTAIDARTVVCLLSHDDRFDAETLLVALRSPAGYVGAMGSRRTHGRRLAALRALGASDAELARLRSPIGLDLGASTPEETALSILAEVLTVRTGASAAPLRDRDGAIHAR